jgi:hypothetical protein
MKHLGAGAAENRGAWIGKGTLTSELGCIPRIAKVLEPFDIARVRAGVHASRRGQASLLSLGQPAIAD